MSSSSQDSTTMQPTRSRIYTRAGGVLHQPQGARSRSRKFTDEHTLTDDNPDNVPLPMTPLPQFRALPAVPIDAPTHRSWPSQSARRTRPLPCCPPSPPPLYSQFSPPPSPQLATSTTEHPSEDVYSQLATLSTPVILPVTPSSPSPPPIHLEDLVEDQFEPQMYDSSSFVIESNYSKTRHGLDCTSKDNKDADIREPYRKRVESNQFTGYRWMLANRTAPRQSVHNHSTKKWIKEKKGRRETVENYDKILEKLRNL